MSNEIDKFRAAFFDLPSRAFGETYIQELLYKILGDKRFHGDEKHKSNLFDAQRGDLRGEYKAVRVVFDNATGNTIYEQIMNSTPMSTRIGSLADIRAGKITSNFQNIKLNTDGKFDFDYLVYVLVDKDGFHIFEISGPGMEDAIKNQKFPNWCDKHGSKETGRNGQFPVRSENLSCHEQNWFRESVPWEKILELSKSIPAKKQLKKKL